MNEQQLAELRTHLTANLAIFEGAITATRQRVESSPELDEQAKTAMREILAAARTTAREQMAVELERASNE